MQLGLIKVSVDEWLSESELVAAFTVARLLNAQFTQKGSSPEKRSTNT